MTIIYHCTLELHDSIYFATREVGRLYETEAVIHNYALAYILGFVDNQKYGTEVAEEHAYRYFCAEQVPKYAEHLMPLNQQGIYITPARAIQHTAVLNTWKYANNKYHAEMLPTSKNIPSFGRTKEIAPESQFEFFIITAISLYEGQGKCKLPKWVRIGKWASKAELTIKQLPKPKRNSQGEFNFPHLLNPLDVMFSNQILSYDTVNMPPVSLIKNVRMIGEFYTFDIQRSDNLGDYPIPLDELRNLKIPSNIRYYFG
jgi:CRISPR-associated protein Csc1